MVTLTPKMPLKSSGTQNEWAVDPHSFSVASLHVCTQDALTLRDAI